MQNISTEVLYVANNMSLTKSLVRTLMAALEEENTGNKFADVTFILLERIEGHINRLRTICEDEPDDC